MEKQHGDWKQKLCYKFKTSSDSHTAQDLLFSFPLSPFLMISMRASQWRQAKNQKTQTGSNSWAELQTKILPKITSSKLASVTTISDNKLTLSIYTLLILWLPGPVAIYSLRTLKPQWSHLWSPKMEFHSHVHHWPHCQLVWFARHHRSTV